jgi:hypothetical protein
VGYGGLKANALRKTFYCNSLINSYNINATSKRGFLFLFYTTMADKKKQATEQATALFESVLVDYETEIVDYKGKAILELTIHNINKETGKPFKYQKFFGIIDKGEAFEFALFKAKRKFDTLED